jgi:hypothetical protein
MAWSQGDSIKFGVCTTNKSTPPPLLDVKISVYNSMFSLHRRFYLIQSKAKKNIKEHFLKIDYRIKK